MIYKKNGTNFSALSFYFILILFAKNRIESKCAESFSNWGRENTVTYNKK